MNLVPPTAMLHAAAVLSLCAVISGCTGAGGTPQQAYTSTMARPVPTDVYPVIEGRKKAATMQMSNEDAASESSRLSALSSRRASGQISEAEYRRRLAELEALAENHGAQTLDEIRK